MLRHGHLEAALHIMCYLKLRHNSRLAFDPSYPHIDYSNFQDCDWTDLFEGAVEAIPPKPGREMTELAANIIAESMFAQCDIYKSKDLVLKAFIDHRQKGSALGNENKRVIIKQ